MATTDHQTDGTAPTRDTNVEDHPKLTLFIFEARGLGILAWGVANDFCLLDIRLQILPGLAGLIIEREIYWYVPSNAALLRWCQSSVNYSVQLRVCEPRRFVVEDGGRWRVGAPRDCA